MGEQRENRDQNEAAKLCTAEPAEATEECDCCARAGCSQGATDRIRAFARDHGLGVACRPVSTIQNDPCASLLPAMQLRRAKSVPLRALSILARIVGVQRGQARCRNAPVASW